jgi:pyridoxine/pyridoxamine 5'-phosphate oxidase
MIKILLWFWKLVCGFCLGTAVYFFITGSSHDGLYFLAVAAASAVMYWMNTKRMKVYVDGPVQRVEEEKKKRGRS